MQLTSSKRRAGMTLIEILVVIAIIAVLASLLLVGVVSVMRKGPEVQTRNDIMSLSTGLGHFYTEYKFYPPSKIRLRAKYSDYVASDPVDAETMTCIAHMWKDLGAFTNIPWAGATAIPAGTNGGIVLEGDQCLVFFLGGIPLGGGQVGVQGFSANPKNPAQTTGDRKKYFDFDAARLISRGGSPFPSYLDSYRKTPFVYFSSGNRPNGYNPAHAVLGVSPYYESPPPAPAAQTPKKYLNPTSFQLISAGLDTSFGPGGFWTAANANGTPLPGKDDMTNFYDRLMGN